MAEGAVGQAVSGNAPSGERAAFWRTVIGEWSSSGQTKVAFCKVRGLSPSAFHWWKGELARRDAAQGKSSPPAGAGQNRGAKASPFVPLRVVASAGRSAAGQVSAREVDGGGLEVVLSNGRRVRVGSDFDGGLLAKVVAVLEGTPC
jgi:hypothetical protein